MGNCLCCEEEEEMVLASYDPMIKDKNIEIEEQELLKHNPPQLQEMSFFPNE